MTTPRDLIKGSLRLCGVIASGETPDPSELKDGLEALNMMISSLSAQSLFVYAITSEDFDLVATQGSYTIGESSADFDTVRPKSIAGAFIRDSGNNDYPVKVRGMEEYRQIVSKSTPGRPGRIFYNPTSPNGTIYTYPVADTVEALHIDSLKPITGTLTLSVSLTLPPEYEEFLKYNLAIRLAPEFGRSVSTEVAAIASQAMDTIITINAASRVEPVQLDIPGVMTGGSAYNIWEG